MTNAHKVKQKRLSFKRKQKAKKSVEFSIDDLKKDILQEAKSLKIDAKTAEIIAENVMAKTEKWVEKRVTFTQNDLHQYVAKAVQKYSDDLSYVYQNRDKII